MDLEDLKIIRDELEKLSDGFRNQHGLEARLHMIDQFRQVLLELRVKAREELDFTSSP